MTTPGGGNDIYGKIKGLFSNNVTVANASNINNNMPNAIDE